MLDRLATRLMVSAALVLGAPGAAWSLEQAGVSAAVRGNIELTREQLVGQQIESGEPLYLQDSIESGPQSGMQILLLDETTFTLGAESELVIDEFVYDPQTGAGKVGAQVVKGAFRFVTGRIGEARPEDMNVKLPAGTVGIRGTIAAGQADPVTKGSLVVLLGPGRETDPTEKIGALKICNVGKCVGIRRPYFATRIPSAGEPPTRPFRISAEELDRLIGQLYAGAEPPTRLAGLPPVGAGGADAGDGGPFPPLPFVPDPGAKERENPNVVDPVVDDVLTIAKVSELISVGSGSATYARSGIPLTDGGSYDFDVIVDFGQQTVDALAFNIEAPSLGIGDQFETGGQSVGGVQSFSQSIIAPETDYLFTDNLFNGSELGVDADLFVGFFNQSVHKSGSPPDFADSLLFLTEVDTGAQADTAVDESPLGGALAPPHDSEGSF